MIGNESNARIIHEFVRSNDDYYRATPPEGWTLIGEGCYRVAFRGPDGFVYKVQHEPDWTTNLTEIENHDTLASQVLEKTNGRARLAAAQFFTCCGVIAMEYVEKCASVWDVSGVYWKVMPEWEDVFRVFRGLGITDTHSRNVWVGSDGCATLFDYAM